MSDEKTTIAENLSVLASPEGFQKYVLGSKKNGTPRAVYDVVKDFVHPKKKKKHKKDKKGKKLKASGSYNFYVNAKKGKKKKKKAKYWHI